MDDAVTNQPPEAKPEQPEGTASAASENNLPAPVKKLTPEEQMALYEEDLKENDWGHQPC